MTEGKTHILILDDDPEELELIQQCFNQSHIGNYQIFTDVEEFFNCFSEDVFLSIIDFNLPNTTAKEVVERIHDLNYKRESVTKCEIIIISGTNNMKVPLYFMNYRKADYFLQKSSDSSFYEELVLFTQQAINRQMGLDNDHKELENRKKFYNSLRNADERE